jgi:hypothetical protein
MATSTPMSPRMRFFFARVFPWGFILCGLLTAYLSLHGFYRAKQSVAWPVATGRIQESSVKYTPGDHDNSGGNYKATVLYTFTISGRTYNGSTVDFCDWSRDSCHAQSVVDRYPKGKVVSVRYLPNDPNVSVLEPGLRLQKQAWFQLSCGLLFFIVGTLLAILLPIVMKNQPNA